MLKTDYIRIVDMKKRLRDALPEERYNHTISTLEKAMELSIGTNANFLSVYYAALLHDVGKYRDPFEFEDFDGFDYYDYPQIIHAPLGAHISQKEYGIDDERILDAIRYHTTGRNGMTIEEKIVFISDAIEETRNYPGVEIVREAVKEGLNEAIFEYYKLLINSISAKGGKIHPLSMEAYASLIAKRGIYVESRFK